MTQQVRAIPRIKTIFVPLQDEIKDKHPHAQLLFDTAGPPGMESFGHNGLFVNVACPAREDFDYLPDTEWVMRQLQEFEASGDDFMLFESPHINGAAYYLKRAALPHIIAVCPAWSAKVAPKAVTDGVDLVDAHTGLPVLKK